MSDGHASVAVEASGNIMYWMGQAESNMRKAELALIESVQPATGVEQSETGQSGLTDIHMWLVIGTFFWGAMFLFFYNTTIIDRLMTPNKEGPVAAKVDVSDRVTAFIHAIVSGLGFGLYAWCYLPASLCNPSGHQEHMLRLGVVLTTSYLVYDLIMVFVVDVVMRCRPVAYGMFIHHINILILFFACLYTHELMWFMAATLFNEISTIPLHVTFLMNAHGYRDHPMFMGMGVTLVVSFFVTRIIGIAVLGVLMAQTSTCTGTEGGYVGATHQMVIITWVCTSIHWLLQIFWFYKILQLAMKKSPGSKGQEQTSEKEPLVPRETMPRIATQAGLGPPEAADDEEHATI